MADGEESQKNQNQDWRFNPSRWMVYVTQSKMFHHLTGPVSRFARQIAGHGYIVAAPSSYHEFVGPEPLAYDAPGTDAGNAYKIQKACVQMNGLFYLCLAQHGETGGHLAFRCALDPRVAAAVCYFATDIHSHSLGEGKRDNSLDRAGEIRGELLMEGEEKIHGKQDGHVPPEGRDLIRRTLHEKGVCFSFYEVAGAQHLLRHAARALLAHPEVGPRAKGGD
ncbi:MAG: hypothetical protein LQ351_006612 [Letrouitia transgressa]|nr:MAG: hypothetical protein LQ351_006612 [Letrouitia transgressa]